MMERSVECDVGDSCGEEEPEGDVEMKKLSPFRIECTWRHFVSITGRPTILKA